MINTDILIDHGLCAELPKTRGIVEPSGMQFVVEWHMLLVLIFILLPKRKNPTSV